MATATLRPNATIAAGAWTVDTAAGQTHHGVTSDNADGTFALNPRGFDKSLLELDFATVAIPAGAQIRSLTPRLRARSDESSGRMVFAMFDRATRTRDGYDLAAYGTAASTVSGKARTRNHRGDPWSQADVDNIALVLQRPGTEDARLEAVECFIDVLYNERPVVTVTGPADEHADPGNQVTSTSTPLVTWTYTDPEGDLQERYRVKIFSAAQYGAAGFDPNTSPSTWDSGNVFSSAQEARVRAILVNGTTYRAYVTISEVGAEGRPALWAFREFVMQLTPPPVPAVSTASSGAAHTVNVTATSTGTTPAPEFLRFEFLDDDGVTWLALRGGERVPTTSGAAQTVTDREPPPNRPRSYRALAGRVVSGQDVLSAPSGATSRTATNDRWRLKDFLGGTTLTLRVAEGEADLDEGEPAGLFSPLGAARRVVISDTLKGEGIALSLTFLSAADWDAFRALRARGETLLLVSPLTRHWYVRFYGDVGSVLLNFGGSERRRASATWVEVDRP